VKVSGIFEDSAVAGSVNIGFGVLKEAGVKRVDNSLSINIADGADPATVKKGLDDLVADLPIVAVQDKTDFADSLAAQINQLLYMVYGLLALSIVIAIIGIVNTLSLSVIERTREIGLLRAVGLSRRRLRRMVTLESVTISVMGAVLGLVLGLVIGVLLQRSLADDLQVLAIPLASLLGFLLVAVVFGVLAAIVPAVRASRMKVLEAIATE
jgi:putative ABC transport system permease protein